MFNNQLDSLKNTGKTNSTLLSVNSSDDVSLFSPKPTSSSSSSPGNLQKDVAQGSSDDSKAETTSSKKYFCKICKQGFTRKHNMVSHELIHSSLKPHVCSVCNSKFRRIHDLKRHEKLHTGEKPYVCDQCNKSFARPDALGRHQSSPDACLGTSKNEKPKEEPADSESPQVDIHAEPSKESPLGPPAPPPSVMSLNFGNTSSPEVVSSRNSNSPSDMNGLKNPLRSILSSEYDTFREQALEQQEQQKQKVVSRSGSDEGNNLSMLQQQKDDVNHPDHQNHKRPPYNTTITTTTTTTTTRDDGHRKHREKSPDSFSNRNPGPPIHPQAFNSPGGSFRNSSVPSGTRSGSLYNYILPSLNEQQPPPLRIPMSSNNSSSFGFGGYNTAPPPQFLRSREPLTHGIPASPQNSSSPHHPSPPQSQRNNSYDPTNDYFSPNQGYISMELYQDLITYTRSLQANLHRMNDRVQFLEDESNDNKLFREQQQHHQDMEDQRRGREMRQQQEFDDRERGKNFRHSMEGRLANDPRDADPGNKRRHE